MTKQDKFRQNLAAKHAKDAVTLRARGQIAQAERLERLAEQLSKPMTGPAYRGVNMVICYR